MGFFNNKPRVSPKEFKKAKEGMWSKGLRRPQINKIEQAFQGNLDEKGLQHGIDKEEIEKTTQWLKEHKREAGLSDKQIDAASDSLKKHL